MISVHSEPEIRLPKTLKVRSQTDWRSVNDDALQPVHYDLTIVTRLGIKRFGGVVIIE